MHQKIGHAKNSIRMSRRYSSSKALAVALAIASVLGAMAQAQISATINGTVVDSSGASIAGAQVTLTEDATNDKRTSVSNGDGYFAFPALLTGTYSIAISAPGFQSYQRHGIILSAGDMRKLSDLVLPVGQENQTVTVEANAQIVPVENGQRAAILDNKDIQQLALAGRNVNELLKVLPGVTAAPNLFGGQGFNAINDGAAGSPVGNGLNLNGVPNRGGTSQFVDGVQIDDPGCDCNSIAVANPDMTQEVSVQSSNFGAEAPRGPTVINAISKSGSAKWHGEGYLYARNDVLNANDWQSNHSHTARGAAHYYYPGGNVGAPIPFTKDKVLFWVGYERILQNLGNTNRLTSFIPTTDMLAGNFTNTPANVAFCQGKDLTATATNGCNDLTGTVLPDGTIVGQGTRPAGMIPAEFLDPGAKALASFWPKPNADPITTPGGYNYNMVIPGIHDGYIFRARADYNLSDKTKLFISWQYGKDSSPSGSGAHIYWVPGNSIPYPGGGLVGSTFSKSLSGHFTHVFGATLTNEFIASWGYGNFPVGPPNPKGAYRSTLNYPYSTVFKTGSLFIPSYSSAGDRTFPDVSEPDIFEPSGAYLVRKELPAFADDLTKVIKTHTVKVGAFTENVSNLQGAFSNNNGNIGHFDGGGNVYKNAITGQLLGSPNNPTANFIMGNVTAYNETNSSPVGDLAYQVLSFYVDDSFKVSNKLNLQVGVRFDHLGHWYDRQHSGAAVFFPDRVVADQAAGKVDPGVYWHGIDSKVPKSGQPDRFLYYSPRFGLSYDLYGDGKTILRGGWGRYRFTDAPTASAAVNTAQSVLTYNLPGQTSVLLSQIPQLPAPSVHGGGINGSVTTMDPNDDEQPLTDSYNFTVSQQAPWNSLFEVAYVGNSSGRLVTGGQSIQGGTFSDLTNVNKVPLGAFFKPDPVTGVVSPNPQNLGGTGSPNNKEADYRPYGAEYGTNTITVNTNKGYSNYNALQVSWNKRSDRLTFNLNYTWSRAYGTGLQIDPFSERGNYGVLAIDRPQVVNTSYAYNFVRVYRGQSHLLGGAVNGWTISGITTWQAGGNLQALSSPNFGLSITGIGAPTYYGTSAAVSIQPALKCDPGTNLGKNQYARAECFAAPAIGTYGLRNLPYLHGPNYFDSDLAVYKSFKITESQNVQFRASAFNFINHPLTSFSGNNQLTLRYNSDRTLNTGTGGTTPTFGVADTKIGGSAQAERILEFAVKYIF